MSDTHELVVKWERIPIIEGKTIGQKVYTGTQASFQKALYKLITRTLLKMIGENSRESKKAHRDNYNEISFKGSLEEMQDVERKLNGDKDDVPEDQLKKMNRAFKRMGGDTNKTLKGKPILQLQDMGQKVLIDIDWAIIELE